MSELTPATTEVLTCLAEEAAEIVQAVTKILRHGTESRHPNGGPTNREALREEIVDLLSLVVRLDTKGFFEVDEMFIPHLLEERFAKKARYMHHQESF